MRKAAAGVRGGGLAEREGASRVDSGVASREVSRGLGGGLGGLGTDRRVGLGKG